MSKLILFWHNEIGHGLILCNWSQYFSEVKAMSHGASKTLFSLETKHKTWCFDVFGVWHTAKHRCYETCLLCFDVFSKFRACSKFRKHVFGCFHWRPMGKRCLRHVTLSSFKMSSTPIKATGPLALLPPDATLFLIELFHSHDALWDIRSPNYRNQSVKRASWTSMRVNFTEKTGVVCTGMGKFKCKTFQQMVFWRPSGYCFFFRRSSSSLYNQSSLSPPSSIPLGRFKSDKSWLFTSI